MPRRKSTNLSAQNTPIYSPQSAESTPEFQPIELSSVIVESLDKSPLILSRPLPPAPISVQAPVQVPVQIPVQVPVQIPVQVPVSVQKLNSTDDTCEPFNDNKLCCELNKLQQEYRQKIGELIGSSYSNSHVVNGCVVIDEEKWEKELYECTLPIIQMIQGQEEKGVWESKLKDYGLRAYPWEVKMLHKD